MKRQAGFGLLGLLAAVLIIGILLSVVLKRYAAQMKNVPAVPSVTAPVQGATPGAAAPACNGRLVGNVCVPTEIRSSSLDAFERMNQ